MLNEYRLIMRMNRVTIADVKRTQKYQGCSMEQAKNQLECVAGAYSTGA